MKIVIAGGHGQIALLLTSQLAAAGHQLVGIIRNPDQAPDLDAVGATALIADLEQSSAAELAAQLAGVDAVVFAAGAGPNSGAARKLTLDRDGAILLADAAEQAGVRRYVIISALATDDFDPSLAGEHSTEIFQVYLRAKSEADAYVRASELDWTVVRPGGLTDEPGTGTVTAAEHTGRGSIPRADVAAVVAELLTTGAGIRRQFELISGDQPIAAAVAGL
ncbi:MAG: SDR family oxidoreductase [Propionibacteriaceae bacterium]